MLKDYETNKPVIHTQRLLLRKLVASDADDLREWLGLPEIYEFWGRKASRGEREPELLFYSPRETKRPKVNLDFKWGIELASEHKVVGMLEVFDIEDCRMGYIAYRLHPEYWNQGITTEALKGAIDFIFRNTELNRLHANANVKNYRSNRVLEICGFTKEGTIRHGKMVREYCDYNIWGLLREDYEAERDSCCN